MEEVKGFRDVSGQDALKREKMKQVLVKKFKSYGFVPAETPVIEYEDFVRGNQQDEAISEIFRLKDKGNRALALRYEFTFQLKRLAKNKRLPFRRYQIGQVFRDEPVSSNRFREFTQCDIDIVGSSTKDEAEILKLTAEILQELKIDATIMINNRKLLNEILDKEKIKDKAKVIKEIDKLDKLPESEVKANLKKYKAQNLISLFKKPESYFSRYKNYAEIKELKKYCSMFNVSVKFSPSLVRGLGYYNGSVFEIKTQEMKETIIAGGSYLVNQVQSTGISFGLDRLSQLAQVSIDKIQCIIISINQDKASISLAQKLRDDGISCFIMDKISKALEYANLEKVPYAIFIGSEELKKKKFKLRDMKTGKELMLNEKDITKKLK